MDLCAESGLKSNFFPLTSAFATAIRGNSNHRSQSAHNKTALLCSRPSNSHVTKKEKVHELPKAGSQANTWVELHRRTYTVFWLDVVFSCGGHFFLLMHFFLILWVNVVGNFKVKTYESLHNDLYLKHSHTQTARWDMSQVLPHTAKDDNGGTQRVTFLKQKQSNTSRLESWRLLLEVLSELSLFFFFSCFGTDGPVTIKSSINSPKTHPIRANGCQSSHPIG